jgi:hypothetical protein
MYLKDIMEAISKKNEIQLEKGLEYEEALKACPWKPKYGDCRAFSYDSKTGIACWM